MIFNNSRFLSFILQIFIEYLLCAFTCVQKIRNHLHFEKVYRESFVCFLKVTHSVSDRAEIQIQAFKMLQPMHFSIRTSSSSDTEESGMALNKGRRRDSRDTVMAEKKVPLHK